MVCAKAPDPRLRPCIATSGLLTEPVERGGDRAIRLLPRQRTDQITHLGVSAPAILSGSVAANREPSVIAAAPVQQEFDPAIRQRHDNLLKNRTQDPFAGLGARTGMVPCRLQIVTEGYEPVRLDCGQPLGLGCRHFGDRKCPITEVSMPESRTGTVRLLKVVLDRKCPITEACTSPPRARRHGPSRRTAMIFFPGPSCVHSAHIGQDCVVHYRWRALFGQRVRLECVEHRAGSSVASVEVQPGLIIKISAWMLDPASCAGMEIGARLASLATLAALHNLLVGQGFRRSSPDDRIVSGEKRDEVFACMLRSTPSSPV